MVHCFILSARDWCHLRCDFPLIFYHYGLGVIVCFGFVFVLALLNFMKHLPHFNWHQESIPSKSWPWEGPRNDTPSHSGIPTSHILFARASEDFQWRAYVQPTVTAAALCQDTMAGPRHYTSDGCDHVPTSLYLNPKVWISQNFDMSQSFFPSLKTTNSSLSGFGTKKQKHKIKLKKNKEAFFWGHEIANEA